MRRAILCVCLFGLVATASTQGFLPYELGFAALPFVLVGLLEFFRATSPSASREERSSRSSHHPRAQWSLSVFLLGAAIRRLPEEMSDAERLRWAEEMKADASAVERRLPRLVHAFGVWRKGAPEMPAGDTEALRPAGREASPPPPDAPAC